MMRKIFTVSCILLLSIITVNSQETQFNHKPKNSEGREFFICFMIIKEEIPITTDKQQAVYSDIVFRMLFADEKKLRAENVI